MIVATLVLGSTWGQHLRPMISPIHYNVTLLPILEHPRLCGHVSIDVITVESINVIEMHAANMQILDASIESIPAAAGTDPLIQMEGSCFDGVAPSLSGRDGVVHFVASEERQMVFLISSQPLLKDRLYRITISYLAQVSDDNRGFFRQSYTPQDQGDQR